MIFANAGTLYLGATNGCTNVLRGIWDGIITNGEPRLQALESDYNEVTQNVANLSEAIVVLTNQTRSLESGMLALTNAIVGGGISGATATTIVHNVMDAGMLDTTQRIVTATNIIAAESLSGTVALARLSGITSNQIDATTDAAYRGGGGTSTSDVQAVANEMAGTGTYYNASNLGGVPLTGVVQTNATDVTFAGWRLVSGIGSYLYPINSGGGLIFDEKGFNGLFISSTSRLLYNTNAATVATFTDVFRVGPDSGTNIAVYSAITNLQAQVGGGGISGATATSIVHNVMDAGMLATSNRITEATNSIAAESLSGTVALARLSGITTNQMAATERDKIAAAVTSETDTLSTVAARGDSWTGRVAFATTGGNVGIGTNTPVRTLDVNGIIRWYVPDGSAVGELQYSSSDTPDTVRIVSKTPGGVSRPLGIGGLGGDAIWIDSVGSIGIGTNTPAAKLDVNGSALIRTNLTVTGTLTVNGGGNVLTNNGPEIASIGAGLLNLTNAVAITTNMQSWGFVDPAPTSAVMNIQWTPYFAATGTVRGIRSKAFSGTVVCDVIRQNWTNAAASYTTVYTGATFGVAASNIAFTSAIAVGDLWGVVSTNVTTATNWWYSMEWTP
jgi:hypothetical protein